MLVWIFRFVFYKYTWIYHFFLFKEFSIFHVGSNKLIHCFAVCKVVWKEQKKTYNAEYLYFYYADEHKHLLRLKKFKWKKVQKFRNTEKIAIKTLLMISIMYSIYEHIKRLWKTSLSDSLLLSVLLLTSNTICSFYLDFNVISLNENSAYGNR